MAKAIPKLVVIIYQKYEEEINLKIKDDNLKLI